MRLLLVGLLALLLPVDVMAGPKSKDYSATQIRVLDNSATMHEHDDGFFLFTSRPVGSEGIPEVVSKGDTIVAPNDLLVNAARGAVSVTSDMSAVCNM